MIVPECPFSSGDFADHVDCKGRYVREWRDGRGPGMEVHQGPEAFDPPFGSGDVLIQVEETESGVPIYALSREHLAWVRRQAFRVRLEMEESY
jgi:hypothetical protein